MNIIFPEWYDDLAEFESESKGCALNFNVIIEGKNFIFNFYDIARFTQDIEDDIENYGYFKDENAILFSKVTRKNIINFLTTFAAKIIY